MAAPGTARRARFFEAAACGVPVLSDALGGARPLLHAGEEILVATTPRTRWRLLRRRARSTELRGREWRSRARARAGRTTRAHARERDARARVRRVARRDGTHVGNHSGGGRGQPHPAARLFEGAAPGREPASTAGRAAARGQRAPRRAHARRRGGPLCFVISPGKSDILILRRRGSAALHLLRRPARAGRPVRRAFRACPFVGPREPVVVGLPDTVWFPERRAGRPCPPTAVVPAVPGRASRLFDAVVTDEDGRCPRSR